MAGDKDDDRRITLKSSSEEDCMCSICLELVVDDGTRSIAKLHCAHLFHLDCIGSAFNMKGAMQCPNCRNLENGQWMYANGSTRPFPEFAIQDWIPPEDLYALTSPPDMQYRVHWCPFGELSPPASLEELEPVSTTYHNEFHGHQGTPVNHSYLAYFGAGSTATPITSNNTDDNPWNSHSNDHFQQLGAAPQYHHHHPPSFSLPGAHVADGETNTSVAQGISRPYPFLFSNRSHPRTSPAVNGHQGNSTQMREQLHSQHHVFNHHRQHHANGPNLASPLVSMTRRGLPMPDQNFGFFVYPPPSASGGHHERETNQVHGWEREWFPRFHGPMNQQTISSFWHRHL
ncbi:unnamed protein product [Cochlearia groenlandica]